MTEDTGLPGANEDLIAAIKNKDSKIRIQAIDQLGRMHTPQAVELIIHALGDRNAQVRIAAVTALGANASPAAAQALIQLLDEDNPKVTSAVEETLASFGDVAVRAMNTVLYQKKYHPPRILSHFVEILSRIPGSEAEKALLKLLTISGPDKLAARTLLERSSADPERILMDENGDTKIRMAAVEALGILKTDHGNKALLGAATNDNYPQELRIACIEALGSAGELFAVDSLVSKLLDVGCPTDIQIAIINSLGNLQDRRAVEPLLTLLASPQLRIFSIKALGRIKDSRAIVSLGDALHDNEYQDRWEINRSGATIIDEWKVRTYPVREAAAEALKMIGTPEAIKILEDGVDLLKPEML